MAWEAPIRKDADDEIDVWFDPDEFTGALVIDVQDHVAGDSQADHGRGESPPREHLRRQFVNQSNHAIGIILRAAAFAADKHSTQRRKNVEASPYINHPISLASILANEGGVTDCEVLCGALLHDTIEDTLTSAEELKGIFGEEVTSIVQEVTDDKSLPKDVRKQLQIEHAFHLHPKAKLVKLADKISNLRDIATSPPAGWPEKRKDEYYDWARQVVDGLRGIHPRLEAVFDDVYRARKR